MLKLLISCWDDGVVAACRYMFVMGSDVVLDTDTVQQQED